MKKIILALFVLFSIMANAQFNYQSTIRYSNGQVVSNQMISLRFNIKLSSSTGTTVYSEIQHPLTNAQGNISVLIGNGTATTGSFSAINWSAGTYYLTVEFFTGTNSCQWINVPFDQNGTIGQIVSYCNGQYIFNLGNKIVEGGPNLTICDKNINVTSTINLIENYDSYLDNQINSKKPTSKIENKLYHLLTNKKTFYVHNIRFYDYNASIDLFLDKSKGKLLSMKYV
jgi:hypothetical protein